MPDGYFILALDLATTTGWAFGSREDGISSSGSLRLTGSSHGDRGAALFRFLGDMVRVSPFHHLIFEAPIPPGYFKGKTSIDASRLLLGLPCLAETYARLIGIPDARIREARPNDVRKHFIGRMTAGGRDETKRAVIQRCRQLGRDPADDNEADAIALFDYQRSLLNARYGSASGPLFGG